MKARKEITATDLCRPADSREYQPIGKLFPHMAEFVRTPLLWKIEQLERSKRNGIRVVIAALSIFIMWACVSLVRCQDKADDFAVVTGTLESATESIHYKGRSGHLDIYLQGSPICYRIPADGYLDYFNRAFFSEVAKGTAIDLSVRASDIAKISNFSPDSPPTVFVRGVRVGEISYCAVEQHLAWQKRNNGLKIYFSVVAALFLAFIVGYKLRERRIAAMAKSPGAARTSTPDGIV